MFLAALLLLAADSKLPLKPGWVVVTEHKSEYATQAAAADGYSFFAVSNTHVARYDRKTGALLDAGTGPGVKHLNSAFVWKGGVYCAHSNYPAKPDESDIRVYESLANGTGRLRVFHKFDNPPGSLVW